MIVYSTCRDCGGLLHVTSPDDTVHPNCTPKPTKAERLAQDWLAAVTACDNEIADGLQELIDELDTRQPRLLDAALLYASWGWPVFPLRTHTKRPATRNGFKDATTDPDRIRAWWTRHPRHNIGLPTGHAFDVIDIDTPINISALSTIQNADDAVFHGEVATSSGGIHYYRKPAGQKNGTRLLPGIDYRGLGGYVVAPPSTLEPQGRAWTWTHRPSPVITGNGDTYGLN